VIKEARRLEQVCRAAMAELLEVDDERVLYAAVMES